MCIRDRAKQFNYPQIYFDDMGVYQLLFIIEDQGILRQMYRSMLGCLLYTSSLI